MQKTNMIPRSKKLNRKETLLSDIVELIANRSKLKVKAVYLVYFIIYKYYKN